MITRRPGRILDVSPRGSAALLRLAVEKICIGLNAEGDTIDQRIGDGVIHCGDYNMDDVIEIGAEVFAVEFI